MCFLSWCFPPWSGCERGHLKAHDNLAFGLTTLLPLPKRMIVVGKLSAFVRGAGLFG